MTGAILLTGVADRADAATRAANGRARTLRPIVLANSRALDFGTLITGVTAGTVTINPRTDARTRTGGLSLVGGGAPGAARFTATGTPAVNAFITIGTAPVLTRVSGTETMTVSNMTLNGGRTRRIPASGILDVRVGGRLNVAANQRDGLYSGSFNLTVDYP
ncbi:DUF4402 domain-containing protein [Sphingomonas sp. SUN039]|uniref:DUF4402 domain-containing protein n=1 Tax=Sphingomonas sp. SUN039 TaxID=2937787 RepID=UPI002164B9D3|nr:DUF4402 domain-containing protein [Sphingomonas sp. SUN039]UVO55098.1 DUF4402 domain-containing protein [Sphingomonas sp. SUN039]